VKFPTTPQERAAAKYKFINASQPFEGAIGAIDCTHVQSMTKSDSIVKFITPPL